jgi:hypothetical protein
MESEKLSIPPPEIMPQTTYALPYVFPRDQAYPLKRNLMRPFPQRSLNDERRYFNQQLSCARKCVECAFGILCAKWHILGKPLEANLEHACIIIKTTCILHNVIRDSDGNSDPHYNVIVNRIETENNTALSRRNNSSSMVARNVRGMFVNFFWQNRMTQ